MPRRRHTDVPWYAELLIDLAVSAVVAAILHWGLGMPLPYAIGVGLAIGVCSVYCCLHIHWTRRNRADDGDSDGFWAGVWEGLTDLLP